MKSRAGTASLANSQRLVAGVDAFLVMQQRTPQLRARQRAKIVKSATSVLVTATGPPVHQGSFQKQSRALARIAILDTSVPAQRINPSASRESL